MRDISKRSIVITNFGAACVRKKSAAAGNEGEGWLLNRRLGSKRVPVLKGSYIRWYIVRIEPNSLGLTTVKWVAIGFR